MKHLRRGESNSIGNLAGFVGAYAMGAISKRTGLPPGGAVVISELLVNDEKTGQAAAALMSLNMLIETVGGRNYTAAEYRTWLEETGFCNICVIWSEAAGANGTVIGYKPKWSGQMVERLALRSRSAAT